MISFPITNSPNGRLRPGPHPGFYLPHLQAKDRGKIALQVLLGGLNAL